MVTTEENGILQDLERERRMIARQTLLKRLWKLRRPKTNCAKAEKNHVVAADAARSNHVRRANHVAEEEFELGAAD